MKRRHSARVAVLGLLATIGLVAAACAPPGPGGSPAPVNWSFKGNSFTVNNSQDETCVLFVCVNNADEPYLIQIAWKVTIGQANSASAWVVSADRGNNFENVGPGSSRTLTGEQQAPVAFNGIAPLDLLDALNPSNKLTVFGTYTWAMEEDFVAVGGSAQSVANIFQDALNSTLASSSLPSDSNALVNMIINLLFNNLGSAVNLLLANIPLLGLGDDLLGGAFYVGIGATGVLGQAIDAALASASIPTLNLLGDNMIPPKIVGGGLYTLTGAKNFTQVFNGADGQHTYSFTAGPA